MIFSVFLLVSILCFLSSKIIFRDEMKFGLLFLLVFWFYTKVCKLSISMPIIAIGMHLFCLSVCYLQLFSFLFGFYWFFSFFSFFFFQIVPVVPGPVDCLYAGCWFRKFCYLFLFCSCICLKEKDNLEKKYKIY